MGLPAGGGPQVRLIGIDGVVEWLGIGNATENVEVLEPRRILVDGDMAAVVGFMRVVARPTGRAYEMDFVHLVTVVGGRVVRLQEFLDTWAAAEAFRPGSSPSPVPSPSPGPAGIG